MQLLSIQCRTKDQRGSQQKPRRADTADIAPAIDRHATNALRNNTKGHTSEKPESKLLDIDCKTAGTHRMILESIKAGAIKGFHRLCRAGLEKTSVCSLCGFDMDDQEHIGQNSA